MKKVVFVFFLVLLSAMNAEAKGFEDVDWKTVTVEEIEALIKAGADVNAWITKEREKSNPLLKAAEQTEDSAVIDALLKAGANAALRDERGRTPLLIAAEKNANPAIIEAFVKAGLITCLFITKG